MSRLIIGYQPVREPRWNGPGNFEQSKIRISNDHWHLGVAHFVGMSDHMVRFRIARGFIGRSFKVWSPNRRHSIGKCIYSEKNLAKSSHRWSVISMLLEWRLSRQSSWSGILDSKCKETYEFHRFCAHYTKRFRWKLNLANLDILSFRHIFSSRRSPVDRVGCFPTFNKLIITFTPSRSVN